MKIKPIPSPSSTPNSYTMSSEEEGCIKSSSEESESDKPLVIDEPGLSDAPFQSPETPKSAHKVVTSRKKHKRSRKLSSLPRSSPISNRNKGQTGNSRETSSNIRFLCACFQCKAQFADRLSLCSHIYKAHGLPCNCAYCDMHYSTMEELTLHIKHDHQKASQMINCWFCPKWYTNLMNDFWGHIWARHKQNIRRCHRCDLHCFGKESLWLHKTICDKVQLTPLKKLLNKWGFQGLNAPPNVGFFPSSVGFFSHQLVGNALELNQYQNGSTEIFSHQYQLGSGRTTRMVEMGNTNALNVRDPRIQKKMLEWHHRTEKPEMNLRTTTPKRVAAPVVNDAPPEKCCKTLLQPKPERTAAKENSLHLPLKKRMIEGRKHTEIDVNAVLGNETAVLKKQCLDDGDSTTKPPLVKAVPKAKSCAGENAVKKLKLEVAKISTEKQILKATSHKQDKETSKKFQCSLCSFSTAYKHSMKTHLTGKHKVSEDRFLQFFSTEGDVVGQRNGSQQIKRSVSVKLCNSTHHAPMLPKKNQISALAEIRKEIEDLKQQMQKK